MKAIHFLIMLMISLGLLVTPVRAQEEMERTGYIVLVKQAEANTPLIEQTSKAYNTLEPRLSLLKHQGLVNDFGVNLETGLVWLKYTANADLSALQGFEIVGDIRVAARQVPPIVQPSASSETSLPSFTMYVYQSCFYMYRLPANSYYTVTALDASGVKTAYAEGMVDTSGYKYDCFPSIYKFMPRHKVVYKMYASKGGSLLHAYTTAIPNYQITKIDKENSLVQGIGPAGKEIGIYWRHKNLNASGLYSYSEQISTITDAKTWSFDLGSTPMRGGDYISLSLVDSNQFAFSFSQAVPYATCTLDSFVCRFGSAPYKNAGIELTQAGTTYTINGSTNWYGNFYAFFSNNAGQPVVLAPGTKVRATGALAGYLPKLTGAIDFTHDQLKGKAPANKYLSVWVYSMENKDWYGAWIKSDAKGIYLVDFSSQVDFVPTDRLFIELEYVDPISGLVTYAYPEYIP